MTLHISRVRDAFMLRVSHSSRSPSRLLLIVLVILAGPLSASGPLVAPMRRAAALAPQVASYRMAVRLDPVAKTVAGSERITYRNPSADTLRELWLRLYLRAFRDRQSVWMDEAHQIGADANIDPQHLG